MNTCMSVRKYVCMYVRMNYCMQVMHVGKGVCMLTWVYVCMHAACMDAFNFESRFTCTIRMDAFVFCESMHHVSCGQQETSLLLPAVTIKLATFFVYIWKAKIKIFVYIRKFWKQICTKNFLWQDFGIVFVAPSPSILLNPGGDPKVTQKGQKMPKCKKWPKKVHDKKKNFRIYTEIFETNFQKKLSECPKNTEIAQNGDMFPILLVQVERKIVREAHWEEDMFVRVIQLV